VIVIDAGRQCLAPPRRCARKRADLTSVSTPVAGRARVAQRVVVCRGGREGSPRRADQIGGRPGGGQRAHRTRHHPDGVERCSHGRHGRAVRPRHKEQSG
jgi:hypothetical protein